MFGEVINDLGVGYLVQRHITPQHLLKPKHVMMARHYAIYPEKLPGKHQYLLPVVPPKSFDNFCSFAVTIISQAVKHVFCGKFHKVSFLKCNLYAQFGCCRILHKKLHD